MSFASLLWAATCGVKFFALAGVVLHKRYRGLRVLCAYLACSLLGDLALYLSLRTGHFATGALAYRRTYFGVEAVMAVLGYLVLVSLLESAFERSPLRLPGLRTLAMFMFSGIATCSGFFIYHLRSSFSLMRFSVEMEQNLAFLAMLLTLLLWIGINLMRVPGVRFRRVVLAFSTLYSARAITLVLLGIFPRAVHLVAVVPLPSLVGLAFLAFSVLSGEPDAPAICQPKPALAPSEVPA